MHDLIAKYFTNKTTKISIQIFRYFFSGGFAFVVYMSILLVLTDFFHFFHLVSLVIAYVLSIFCNFTISKYFVFVDKKTRSMPQLVKFFGVAMVGLILQFLIVWSFTRYFSVTYLLANIFASALIFVLSFSLNKIITFRSDL